MTILGDLLGYNERGLDITGSPKGDDVSFFNKKEGEATPEPHEHDETPDEDEDTETTQVTIFLPEGRQVVYQNVEDLETNQDSPYVSFTYQGTLFTFGGLPYAVEEKE